MADSVIFRRSQNVTFKRARMPRETISFSFKTNQDEIRRASSVRFGHRSVFGTIKHINRSHHGTSGDQIRILGHISRSVDFTVMRNLLADGELAFCVSIPANFLCTIDSGLSGSVDLIVGGLDLRDLQVVLITFRRMGADQQALDGIVLSFRSKRTES